jgi:hypothetical protein
MFAAAGWVFFSRARRLTGAPEAPDEPLTVIEAAGPMRPGTEV